MLTAVNHKIFKIAKNLTALDESLSKDDIELLNSKVPSLIKKVKENIEKKSKPFKNIKDDEKLQLLAFVVYKRQNLVSKPNMLPNQEDAARILHGTIYDLDKEGKEKKKILKNLEDDLKAQLSKAGLEIN